MSKLLSGNWQKYLIAVTFLVLVAFCGYFYFAFSHVNNALLQEKIIDRQFEVNLICDEMDRFVEFDIDWDSYNYADILSYVVEQMDDTRGTYAILYDDDFNNLLDRDGLFPLHCYPDLISEILTSERGEMTIQLEHGGKPMHDVHLYYRWVPSDETLTGRMLVLIGVSKYSVDNNISDEIIYGAVILIIVTSLFILAMVIVLCQLGHIYTQREGADKWRKKTFL